MNKPSSSTGLASEILASGLGLSLLLAYLAVFTVGSQVSSQGYANPRGLADAAMFELTNRESSVCILGIVAACLGAWRRLDLTRAPGPGQRNYISLAMLASFVSFLSGYDKTFFDRIIKYLAGKIGLGAAQATPAPEPAPAPAPAPRPVAVDSHA